MPDRHFDHSELDAFARELAAAPAKILPALIPVANKAGVGIKRTMKKDASGHRHLPGLAAKVSYDVETTPTTVTVEVGFIAEGQGELANIAAFGTSKTAPVMDITRGLYEEAPRFAAWVAKAAAEAL
jgi:hypothetical protein